MFYNVKFFHKRFDFDLAVSVNKMQYQILQRFQTGSVWRLYRVVQKKIALSFRNRFQSNDALFTKILRNESVIRIGKF